jgi:hypothetical protein
VLVEMLSCFRAFLRFRAVNIGDIDLKDDGDFRLSINPDRMKSVKTVLTFGFSV